MANVFGNPITDATLKAMAKYMDHDTITSLDRARVALNMQTAHMRATNALTYVENLKQQWGTGVSTLCLIYNATGNTLTLTSFKDWHGHIGQAPYPQRIQNGQWGAFLHVKSSMAPIGSCSAAVFRGKTERKEVQDNKENFVITDCDYMMAWSSPWGLSNDNSVWAEAQVVDSFNDAKWAEIYGKFSETRYLYRHTWNETQSTITTGSNTSPVLEAVFTLEKADNS